VVFDFGVALFLPPLEDCFVVPQHAALFQEQYWFALTFFAVKG